MRDPLCAKCAAPRRDRQLPRLALTAGALLLLALLVAPVARAEQEQHDTRYQAAGELAQRAAEGKIHHGQADPEVHHLDNWFSLSFGPDKEHKNAPFFFSILNFVVLVWLLVRFGGKPFREYLQNRSSIIASDLKEAAALHNEARKKLVEIDSKLRNLDAEIAGIKQAVANDAQLEKERIIQRAHEEADRIIAQADKTLERELRRARRTLEAEAVSAALEAAEKLIKQRITDGDRKRLNEDYLSQISSAPGGTN